MLVFYFPAHNQLTASVQLDEKVAKMVDMGFVSKMAYEALRRTDGDIDRAIELLTQQYAFAGGRRRGWGPPLEIKKADPVSRTFLCIPAQTWCV